MNSQMSEDDFDPESIEQQQCSAIDAGEMTAEERQMAERYATECQYERGTIRYDRYQDQVARRIAERDLPDLLETWEDLKEGAKPFSRRVICYVPWELAEDWKNPEALSPSILLQQAMRGELDEICPPRICPGCGGEARYNTLFVYTSNEGNAWDNCYDAYTCGTCGRSHMECMVIGRAHLLMHPKDVEEYEIWRHDAGIVWVGEGDDDGNEFDEARRGLIRYTEYCRAREKDPGSGGDDGDGWEEYIAAHEGKQQWDEFMAEWVAEIIEQRNGDGDPQPARESETAADDGQTQQMSEDC